MLLRVLPYRLLVQCNALLLMKVQTKKLTTAAVCTALAVIMCAATAYLPLSFMPLYLAAFCIFLACKRGSLPYGLLCAAASIGLMFLMSGLTVKWLMFVLIFAPYGIVAVFLEKLTYFKWKTALIRAVIAIAFFNLTVGVVYLIATNVLTVGLDININVWVSKVGGYAVLAVIATVVLVPLDFIFCALAITVLKKIPANLTKAELVKQKKPAEQKTDDNKDQPEYDIFGYEIRHDENDKGDKQ
ncbi:MAG: hypothetical protein K2M47_05045 [Clostridiales bacterium]|nr:hypothetical protein [Clostridiales bacterium]